MSDETGFIIETLTLKGPTKTDTTLTFGDGLNVVSGASDTGKSYALACIDYAFGARKPPSPIPAAAGYDAVALAIVIRKTNERFVFERGLTGGEVKLTKFNAQGGLIDETIVSARHSSTDPNTLSGILLSLSDLYGKQIRTNKSGDRRNISFRDVAYLTVVDEERIIARHAPQLSANRVQNTAQSETFGLLVSGAESGIVHSLPKATQTVGVAAKLELIESMLTEAETRFSSTGVNRDTIDSELASLDSARTLALAEYERARLEIAKLEASLAEQAQLMRHARLRQQVVGGLVNRFTLLDAHYQADTERLHAIEESGKLLEAIPSTECPVCGAAPDLHSPNEQYRPDEVVVSARAEAVKIGELRHDLAKVLAELELENAQLEEQAASARQELQRIQTTVEYALMPRVRESAASLHAQDSSRDSLIQAKSILTQVDQLTVYAAELNRIERKVTPASTVVTNLPTTGEMDEFTATVQKLLESWKYPEVGRVVYSENDQDLVISGQSRISHGKGVRALTCSAFVVGLLRHCRAKQLPHPSVVLLDSPLVAYREPDSDSDGAENQQLRMAGVKEAFYRSLAGGDAKGQVIVFENEDPPEDMAGTFNHIHFSKNSSGRYGLFSK